MIAACATLLALAACQTLESGDANQTTTAAPRPSALQDQTAAASAEGLVLQTQAPGAALGEGCHQDQECTQPLRCLELACAPPPAVAGEVSEMTPRILLAADTDHPTRVYLEVADTPFEVQRGLMFRTQMAADWGMLFVFPDEALRSFWMRNTYLGLDMLFIRSDGVVVGLAENARPLDEGPRYESGAPARYVLELNAGSVSQHALQVGQKVRLLDVPGQHDPRILQ